MFGISDDTESWMRAVDPETFKMLGDVEWSDDESVAKLPPGVNKPQQQPPRANSSKPPQPNNARNSAYRKY